MLEYIKSNQGIAIGMVMLLVGFITHEFALQCAGGLIIGLLIWAKNR